MAMLMVAARVGAVKVEVAKPAEEPPADRALVRRSVDLSEVEKLGAALIAEYPTYYLLEVPDGAVSKSMAHFDAVGVAAFARPELDAFRVNGYEFRRGSAPPSIPADLQLADYSGNTGLYLVQMVGPNRGEWEQWLRQAGEVIGYYPENAFLIRAKPGAVGRLTSDPVFQQVGVYQPALKIRGDLLDYKGLLPVVVVLDGGQGLASITAMLESLAAGEVFFENEGPRRTPLVYLTASEVRALAFQPEVLWLEPAGNPRVSDERQGLVLGGKYIGNYPTNPEYYDNWLASKGFCTSSPCPQGCYCANPGVAVFDTGLDKNLCNTNDPTCPSFDPDKRLAHPDLAGREVRFHCANRNGVNGCYGYSCGAGCTKYNYSDIQAHGTAVASIIAGNPLGPSGTMSMVPPLGRDVNSFYLGSGIAPTAQIIAFRAFPTGSSLFDLPGPNELTAADWQTWYSQLPAGTRFANMSVNDYGADDYVPGQPEQPESYNTFAQRLDELVRDSNGGFDQLNPITISVSAGNNVPGGYQYVLSPANAKNVISAGAGQSYRTCVVGPCTFDTPQFQNYPCKTANSIKDVAEFSNRGYGAEPNRFKPDLVVPSTRVGAAWTRSDPNPDYGCIMKPDVADPNGRYYTRFWGTSASAPVVTGSAVLVDEWYYQRTNPHVRPSPAMTKAMLVAHADDLYGGLDERTGQTIARSPAMAQGWGRVNLDKLFQISVGTLFFDEDRAPVRVRRFRPGDASWSTNVLVADSSKHVILVLVWTDAPSAPNAGALAVNKLVLYVHDGNYHYTSNVFDTASPSDPLRYSLRRSVPALPDGHNTVQVIRIRAGQIVNNDFTIEVSPWIVSAMAVPTLDGGGANQDFALYVYNARY